MKNILAHLRRADQNFDLIQNGDKVAVGVSGGKDSLLLLKALVAYQKFNLKKFELVAVTVDCTVGYSGGRASYDEVAKFCKDLGITYHIEPTQIFEIIFDKRAEKSPCSLCSKMRRGVLGTVAKRFDCNKVALGHHADDLIETFLLSMLYEGRLSTFAPKSFLDRTGITVIRPFIYATEKEISAYKKTLPIVENICRVNHQTRREYMKDLVSKIDTDIKGARGRMIDALFRTERYNLFDTSNRKG